MLIMLNAIRVDSIMVPFVGHESFGYKKCFKSDLTELPGWAVLNHKILERSDWSRAVGSQPLV